MRESSPFEPSELLQDEGRRLSTVSPQEVQTAEGQEEEVATPGVISHAAEALSIEVCSP
jgi:hypothetical protein